MKYNIDYITKLAQRYYSEARKCYENKRYISSFILYGATLEALLLAVCICYSKEVRKTTIYLKKKKWCKRKRGIFLEFTLKELLDIARKLNWIPFDEKVENIGKVENWIQWVKETRNLVHPACWLKPDKCFGNIHRLMRDTCFKEYKKFVKISEETISGIDYLLQGKINKDLMKWYRKRKRA